MNQTPGIQVFARRLFVRPDLENKIHICFFFFLFVRSHQSATEQNFYKLSSLLVLMHARLVNCQKPSEGMAETKKNVECQWIIRLCGLNQIQICIPKLNSRALRRFSLSEMKTNVLTFINVSAMN